MTHETADLVIRNGKVMTFDRSRATAQAVAVKDGKILAVGSNDEIATLQNPSTQSVDAAGASVLPGFIESHVHLFGGSAELDSLNLTGVTGHDNLADQARQYGAKRPDDRLVFAVAADYGMLGKGTEMTRQDLDRAMPDRPFAMMAHDHHTVWANTRALELAGIVNGGDAGEGCEIVMGDDGLASGELRETGAFEPILALTPLAGRDSLGYVTGDNPDPPATADERALDKDVLRRGLQHCASHGITSLHNMDGNFYQLELLDDLRATGDLLCRTQVPFHLKNYQPLSRLEEAAEMRRRYCDDMLWSGRVKMFMDGVIDSRTAFMLAPYPDRPDSVGDPLFAADHFNEACCTSDAMGLQISVHAIGDAAVRRTLDGYQSARDANGARDSRHRVEHIEVLHAEDLPRFAELGVIASMQPLHSPLGGFFDPPLPDTILRDDQLKLCFPWQTLRDAGAMMIFSSDWPVVPVDVMPSIKGAVAPLNLGPLWGDQRQTVVDALAGYTRDGAYAEFNEHKKGRIKAGYLADLVVMSHDLEAMDPQELDQAKPVRTLCGGRTTFSA